MILLDLFSGIGGFHEGFIRAGFTFKKTYFSEVDKHAIAIYKQNFKESEYVGSVTDVQQWGIERPNIITFGSPCQDFSLAGKRKGLEGQKSSLIEYAIMAIKRFRPDFFIWENVKGTYSSNGGRDFQEILREFADIGGYRLEWQLLNTSWFLPQNRERIYLVGHLAKPGRSFKQVFPFTEADGRAFEGPKQTANCFTAGGNSGGMHRSMTLIATNLQGKETANTIRTGGALSMTEKHNWDVVKINSVTKQGYEEAKEGDSVNFSHPNSETRRGRFGEGKAQTLETSCNQGVLVPYSMGSAKPGRSCIGSSRVPEIGNENGSIRRLTEIECERLQGFKDNWTQYGNYDGEVKKISSTQRYRGLGNAVTVDVVEAIVKRLKTNYQ